VPIRPILTWPDQHLSQRSAPADPSGDLSALARDMLDTMYAAKGRGLAAPQIGVMTRFFVMDETWKQGVPSPIVAINPRIIWSSPERETGPEGCLSIPGMAVDVTRHAAVRATWTTLDGHTEELLLTGFAAVCAQHEIDHLDGLTTFDRVDANDRARLIRAYRG
jgi:peptide deformylase